MATVGTTAVTLSDWGRRINPDGKVAKIIEILNDTNEILDDMVWKEGNLPTGHKTTIRSGLPTVAWRLLNYGVQPSKSRTVQITDNTGMLEAYAEVDADLAELNNNSNAFRLSEDVAFIEAMSQTLATTLFYGNTATDPEKFLGFAPRYNLTTAENGGNIIDAGGTGSDNTSVWLVTWDESTCHGIFPKGSTAGIHSEDKGKDTVQDAAGGNYEAYRTHYQMKPGLTLRDWRYVVRIANVDVSSLIADGGTVSAGANLITDMIKAIHKLPTKGRGMRVFYANETIETYLDLQTLKQSNMNVSYKTLPHGEEVMTFRGIMVKRCDALLNTEATVS